MKFPTAVLSSMGVVLVTSGTGSAATFSVPSQYATIQAGIDAAAAGDTVLVAPGHYMDAADRFDGAGFLGWSCAHLKSGIALISEAGPEVTTIDLPSGGLGTPDVVSARALTGEIRVEGFTITSVMAGVEGIHFRDNERGVFENCVFRDFGSGTNSGGVNVVGTPDAEIRNCEFRNLNVSSCVGGTDGSRIVSGCLFENITGIAIGFGKQFSTAVLTATVTDCELINVNVQPGRQSAPIGIGMFDDVTITGCVIRNCTSEHSGGINVGGGGTCLISDNLFLNNHVMLNGKGGATWVSQASGTLSGNTIVGCSQQFPSAGGAAIFCTVGDYEVSHNVIADCFGTEAVGAQAASNVTSSCNVFWNNAQGNAFGVTLDITDVDADPQFCDPASDNYTVDALSPCLPQNSPGCTLIGAFGQGCGVVSIESSSWGSIKSAYRSPTD